MTITTSHTSFFKFLKLNSRLRLLILESKLKFKNCAFNLGWGLCLYLFASISMSQLEKYELGFGLVDLRNLAIALSVNLGFRL
jgi:hypothetical protein